MRQNNRAKRSIIAATLTALVTSLVIPSIKASADTDSTTTVTAKPSSSNVYTTTLSQDGNVVSKARGPLRMSRFGTNLIPTGVAALPNDVLIVTVTGENLKKLPTIVFTQAKGDGDNWRRSQTLKKGVNVIKVPTIYNAKKMSHQVIPGGAIYLENPYTASQQGDAPTVEIKGGIDFPLYIQGKTNEDTFKKELAAYADKVAANPSTYPDIFEYDSERILYAGLASGADRVFNDQGYDISNSVGYWDDRVDDMFTFAGLSDTATETWNNSAGLKTTIRVMQPYGGAYADDDHIGVRQGYNDGFLRTNTDWGIIHEIGHQMDQQKLTFSEITNNMWSVNFYYKAKKYNWGVGNAKDVNGIMDWTDGASYSNRLEMFWNLEEAHPGFWAKIQSLYRQKSATMTYSDPYFAMVKYFAINASDILQRDLTEYFEYFNFLAGNEYKDEILKHMQQYEPLEKKYQYYNNSIKTYSGTGFTSDLKVAVKATTNASAHSATLTFGVNSANANNILGYEVRYNGKVIGFSRDTTFKHTNPLIDFNKNVTYTVTPYDKLLNAGKPVEFNTLPDQLDQDSSDSDASGSDLDLPTSESASREYADAVHTLTVTKVREILTAHEDELSDSEEIYMINPAPAEFDGTAVDEKIVKEIQAKLATKINGNLTVVISDTRNFTSVEQFLNAMSVGFQADKNQPIYYYTSTGVTVY